MLEHHDHRFIGQRMELFHLQEEAPGMVFWHPRGLVLYRLVEQYVRDRMREDGYQEVRTPQLLARGVWEASGHWENFSEGMFMLDDGERQLAIKPVSCPGHAQIWKRGIRSYRELPLRMAELGVCHRNEPRGALLGLMRLRQFVQDDGHVFCENFQVEAEVRRFCALLRSVYAAFGLEAVAVKFSTRPALRAGADDVWDQAEAALLTAAEGAGLVCELQPGEGAFYGPKLEFVMKDGHGRAWQCGTLQLDFVLPERFDLQFIDAHGERRRPVMIHRAILGSLERFVGVLLEHFEGKLPVWLAPEQVVVASIADPHAAYAAHVADALRRAGVRCVLDVGPDSLARKIVEAERLGIPLVVAVGRREVESETVSVRRGSGAIDTLPLDAAVADIARLARAA